jgi:hypothetical protein
MDEYFKKMFAERDRAMSDNVRYVAALEAAAQCLNESGTGEMGLLNAIHAAHAIIQSALTAGERACDQPMLCRWCDKVHVGGPENCGRPEAELAKAFTAGQQTK